jgi:serine/threonine protein kinase
MTPNSGRAIELFTEASQLPVGERAAFLERACAGDDALRQKIEALLRSNDRAGGFLEKPADATIGEVRIKATAGEKAGDQVGRYKLVQQIGEGGCGVVFLAEQQEPVVRRVALKVVKPGMDTKSVIARFEAERQALALMDHPNIAHVFDAGATASGRPYFVMELVEGVKITDYCDQHALPIEARLKLFVQVCDALQHAHQKGIIHRDIKPSNILVTTGADGKPAPKVIDFGIAKATTGQQLTDKTIFTALEMLIGTPAYMSPEQAALTTSDVDTRTDIYSLGVLLYELLTGTTPFDTRALLKAGLDEVRRVIRDEEPARPSTRLSTMVSDDLTNFSKHHGADPPKLIREMRGELDWIVMKALEKDRQRRYQTSNSLAEDIQRHLENETVSARPPSRLYQFQKLVSRHKLEFAASGIVVAILVVALIVTSWSLSKEKRAHREADRARSYANEQRTNAELRERVALTASTRSRDVSEFLKLIVFGAHPIVANGRDTSISQEILDRTVTNLDLYLTNQPEVRADMKMWYGGLYVALGNGEKADRLLRDALAYYREFPQGSEEQLSDTLSRLSLLHMTAQPRELAQAEKEAREALGIEAKRSANPTTRTVVLETRLGYITLLLRNAPEAERIFRKALAEGQLFAKEEPEKLLDTRGGLVSALNAQNKFEEAEKLLSESVSIARERLGPEHPYVANDLFRLAAILDKQRHFDKEEDALHQCLDIRRKTLPADHPAIGEALLAYAEVLAAQDKMVAAAESYGNLLDFRLKKFGDHDARVLDAVNSLTEVFLADGKQSQFEQLAAQFPDAWIANSDYWARQGRWAEATTAASRFLDLRPDDHSGYHLMAPLLVQTGQRQAYEDLCQKITARFAGNTNPYTADRMAKDCLILPRPGADLKAIGELAEIAVTRGEKDSGALPFFLCCKALAEYRLGHWSVAVDGAGRAAENSFPYARAEAYAILAMAQHRLNQAEGSRANLKKCAEVVEAKFPKLKDGNLGQDWRDWIIAHALLAEAQGQIEGTALPAGGRAVK